MNEKLTHIDDSGRAMMVDVGSKAVVLREATATGAIQITAQTSELIRTNAMKKGDVLTVAEIAAIQAAKRTDELIPLCHTILLNKIEAKAELKEDCVTITATARCHGKTGVEMEALTAVSVGLLTIYDMCKAVDKQMVIGEIRLLQKIKHEEK
jgi:cyclic pyranopterin monophosphate synthase